MKVFLAIATLAVGLGVAVMVFGADDDGTDTRPRFAPSTNGDGSLNPSPSPFSTPTPEPQARTYDLDTSGGDDSEPIQTTFVSGPHLVASDAIGNNAVASTQQRVFRAPDGTVAILYHRPGGLRGELQEIILVHSHDDGRTWHGEVTVGLEAPDATYSGVMDEDGNLYVAYGREAEGRLGGAIKLRKLRHQRELHGWVAGPQHRIVWDWPGTGSSSPVLALTGNRLWLAYRHYDTSKTYALLVQYADPDSRGDYPPGKWSSPRALFPPSDEPRLSASLVPHGAGLSAFYIEGSSGVRWSLLRDAEGDPERWRKPQLVVESRVTGQEVKFSAAADTGGNIHLTVGRVGLLVTYVKYDGTRWSDPRAIAVNNVYGVSIGTDGQNAWAFWVQKQISGYEQIRVRRWIEEGGWDRTATSPWPTQFGTPAPLVLVYRSRNDSYADVTRYATSLITAGPGANLAEYFEQPGDMLYLGNEERFDYGPLILTEKSHNGHQPPMEYWDGSEWTTLPLAYEKPVSVSGTHAQDGAVAFSPPKDWQPTEVNGATRYYLRLVSEDVSAFKFTPSFGLGELMVAASPNNIIDLIWSEHALGGGRSRLWYGAVSLGTISVASDTPEHEHKLEAPGDTDFASRRPRLEPLPEGSPRQYRSVSLDKDETYQYQLLDGQVRYIKLVDTQLVFRTQGGVTVWATATVEVAGPGLEPQQVVIPAAYFQSPVILSDVRVYVEITKEFNDFRLRDGGGTEKAARLMLSDARYSLTDVSQYRWPFPGMMWGIGSVSAYYQSIGGSGRNMFHHGAFDQGMPYGTPIRAWHTGSLGAEWRAFDWVVILEDAEDSISSTWHRALHVDQVDITMARTRVEPGQKIAVVTGDKQESPSNNPHVHWGAGSPYDWQLLLAEWYVAHSTPTERSYVKDWLVLGPFNAREEEGPLLREYLTDEGMVAPKDGDPGPGGLTWKRFDSIVPGVVNVAEALAEFTNSGWARVNGNFSFSVAYFVTYIYSPYFSLVLLNIGSSDAVKIWVDEEVLLEEDTFVPVNWRCGDWSIIPDSYRVQARLHPGWNRVLLKLSQRETQFRGYQNPQKAWQLTFRVSDPTGNPIPGLAISPERDRSADPLQDFLVTTADPARVPRPVPPNLPEHRQCEADSTEEETTSRMEQVGLSAPNAGVQPQLPSTIDASQWLHVEGNRIIDESGNAILLRGVNVENWQWIWNDTDDKSTVLEFERLAIPKVTSAPPDGWGANLIHVDFSAGPVNSDDQEYLAALDEIVSLAKSNGAYTLLTYRYGDQPMNEVSRPDQAGEDALARLAARYQTEPAVLYGLAGEPRDVSWSELKPRYTSMIDAIRANNPQALIAVAGTEWGRYVHQNLSDPIPRDNLIFKSNPFDTWQTIQFGDENPLYRLDEVAAVYPVILGGFGLGFRMTEMQDLISLLDFVEANGISWAGWLFHDQGCPCMLKKPWQAFEPTEYGEEIRRRLQEAASTS